MPPGTPTRRSAISSTIRRLTDEQIATIDAWVRTAPRKGDATDLPPAPVFPIGWHIQPDVGFTIPESSRERRESGRYEYIYVPTNFTEDKLDPAAEVLPGDRRVVHHATVVVNRGRQSSEGSSRARQKPTPGVENTLPAPASANMSRRRRWWTMGARLRRW